MITNVRLDILISMTHKEWSYELEFKSIDDKGVKSSLCLKDNDISFWRTELDSLLTDNCDFYWNMGKEVAESCGLHFAGYVECDDFSEESPEYEILKKQVDKLNEKYGTTIGFGV